VDLSCNEFTGHLSKENVKSLKAVEINDYQLFGIRAFQEKESVTIMSKGLEMHLTIMSWRLSKQILGWKSDVNCFSINFRIFLFKINFFYVFRSF
jgi:hypothetical protein